MNEENNFSIDVNAEMQSLKFDEASLDVTPSEFMTIQPEEQLGEQINPTSMEVNASVNEVQQTSMMETEDVTVQSVSLSAEDIKTIFGPKMSPEAMGIDSTKSESVVSQPMEINAQLVDPIVMESAEVNVSKAVNAQSSTANISNMQVKMDASDAFKKAESVAQQVNDMRQGMDEVAKSVKSPWLPTREKDEFEERPTTEPTNLIFEQRKARMMVFPEWS